MVSASEQLDALALANNEDDKPPDSGYSPVLRISPRSDVAYHRRQDSPNLIAPRGDDGVNEAALDNEAPVKLKPNESLTSRLLQSIAPSARADAAAAENGPRSRVNRSSSLPNLDRRRGHEKASDAVHPSGDAAETVSLASIEKAQRVHTFAGTVSEKYNPATLNAAGPSSAQPNAADVTFDPPVARPALLSKTLLEPKKRLGKNPSFRQCMINVLRYSWLNVLFVFVPVRDGLAP